MRQNTHAVLPCCERRNYTMDSRRDFQDEINVLCDHLANRTAILFLGAGVNHGTKNALGESFPLGDELASEICKDLLESPELKLPLDEASEIARYRLGTKALNDYLFDKFSKFQPSPTHLALAQLPWDTIYTTNYDCLVETAFCNPAMALSSRIRPIVDVTTSMQGLGEDDIAYYKLHGSVDVANTPAGRLILTKDDYRFYEAHRRPLFRRLKSDLSTKTVLFVGYSFRDPNFRAIINDCREELDIGALPLSFAVRKGGSPVEDAFWREKHNVDVIDADACDFLLRLSDTWKTQPRTVVSFAERSSRNYGCVDETTSFQRIGGIFYQVHPHECTGVNNAELFFRGASPNWGTIRDGIPPERDAYWTLMEYLFADIAEPKAHASAYLVTGHAGTGKTTLIRSVAYAITKDFSVPVLVHVTGTPLDIRVLGPLRGESDVNRIIIIVHHAGDILPEIERFLEDANRAKVSVSLILEERRNQWQVACNYASPRFAPAEIELGSLSGEEIDRILEALERYGCLGKLTSMPIEYRRNHFLALANKELLVALRELTSESRFDEIIRDEYNCIPRDIAKKAYLYVAALGQADLGMRYETLIRVLNLNFSQLGSEIFTPTDGVLLSGEVTGCSRHNCGFRLQTRHPVIASVIFAHACVDDRAKFNILAEVVRQLDPGFQEDRALLEQIVHRKSIVNTLSDPELRRTVYDLLEEALPDEVFVLQHRSILERDIGDHVRALFYAQKAVRLDTRNNPTLRNTLGMAFEYSARFAKDNLQRKTQLREADRLFDDGIRRDRASAFDYLGKYNVMRQRLHDENDEQIQSLEQARIVTFLEEAYEATGESSVIAGVLAREQELLGQGEKALPIIESHVKRNPTDFRLRDTLVQMLISRGKTPEALSVALEGVQADPTSWRLQRHVAQLLRKGKGNDQAVKGHYEAAMRHRQGDLRLTVEFAAFLFEKGAYAEAAKLFSLANDYRIPVQMKRQSLTNWCDETGKCLVFKGKVIRLRGAAGYVLAVPQNFEAFFWRTKNELDTLREGDPVSFKVRFSALGATAWIERNA